MKEDYSKRWERSLRTDEQQCLSMKTLLDGFLLVNSKWQESKYKNPRWKFPCVVLTLNWANANHWLKRTLSMFYGNTTKVLYVGYGIGQTKLGARKMFLIQWNSFNFASIYW